MNKEQINSDKKVLASLEAEYNRVRRVTDSIRAFTTDLNFEDLVPDSQERCLMVDELQAYDYIRTNLMNRIRFYRNRIKVNSPQPWEIDKAMSEQDEQSRPVCGDGIATHHCGLDAGSPCGDSVAAKRYRSMVEAQGIHIHDGNTPSDQWGCIENLAGYQVVHVGNRKCENCPADQYGEKCIKLELVGGAYLCLAQTPNTTTE